ncbi:hypothetical protein BIW11_10131, partial [Tropilaelaps mercedesae]
GTCYETTPFEMTYEEADEFCTKKGGQLWPTPTDSTADTENDYDSVLEHSGSNRKTEEKFVSWIMAVHNLSRVWAAPGGTMPPMATAADATSTSTRSTSSFSTSDQTTNAPELAIAVGNTRLNVTKIKKGNDENSRALPTGVNPAEVNKRRGCGVYPSSLRMREAVRSLQESSCNEAVFGICVRGPSSCGRPALPKRMASWRSLGRLAPGAVFAAFRCEKGYFISGPPSVRCKKQGGFRQQMGRSMNQYCPVDLNSHVY